ncbi:MAG: ABC transporter permease [Oceanobacter sp.]
MLIQLAYKSLLSRKGSVIMTVLAISVSVMVLLGVEHVRQQTRDNFSNTVSGVDLVVGARTGSLNLLLYSVFRIGNPTNNIQWSSYQTIANSKSVAWAVPMSLGDSHKGYRVLGTSQSYFEHFRYGKKHPLEFSAGVSFSALYDVVLGSQVAAKLGYQLGDQITLSHGVAATSFSQHKDSPFKVVGILKPTGTPVDQTVHVSLAAIEAIHWNWQPGAKRGAVSEQDLPPGALEPKEITAMMLGLKSRMAVFKLQRNINQFKGEPLTAILPGVALTELWHMMGMLENSLRAISALVLLSALLGLAAVLMTSIRERKPELALLRMMGASPWWLLALILIEIALISLTAIVLGIATLYLLMNSLADLLTAEFGLRISTELTDLLQPELLGTVMASSLFVALVAFVLSRWRSA